MKLGADEIEKMFRGLGEGVEDVERRLWDISEIGRPSPRWAETSY